MNNTQASIEEWTSEHTRWPELVVAVEAEGQTSWAFDPFFASFERHFLVALPDGEVAGFLMFVVWEIGPHDRGLAVLELDGAPLTEAKVIAFGVPEARRRQGIGRALQEETIRIARQLGCYQVRSVSGNDYEANHRLKLSMGFAVEPMERESPSFAFVMPLRRA